MLQLPPSQYPELDKAFHLNSESPDLAIDACNKFLAQNPPNDFCYRILFNAYKRKNDWSSALIHANNLVEIDPLSETSYFQRARAYYRVCNFDDAIKDCMQAIVLDTTNWLGTTGFRLQALSYAALGDVISALEVAKSIPEFKAGEWYPPVDPIPAGTKAQFTAMVERMAHQVRDQQNS